MIINNKSNTLINPNTNNNSACWSDALKSRVYMKPFCSHFCRQLCCGLNKIIGIV